MSTIKSNNEDLNLNADGVGNVVNFQENGVTQFTSEEVNNAVSQYVRLSDYATIHAAITAIGATETVLVIDTDATMTQDDTIPATLVLEFIKGSTIDGSWTLTVNGIVTAGSWQIFGSSVTVDLSGMTGEANAFWTGLDLVDIVAAKPKVIFIPGYKAYAEFPTYAAGDLVISDECKLGTNGVSRIYGEGRNSVVFSTITDSSNLLTYDGTGNDAKLVSLNNFRVDGNDYQDGDCISFIQTVSNERKIHIADMWIYNCGGDGIVLGDSGALTSAYNFVIERNSIRNGTEQSGKYAIRCNSIGPQNVIRDNELWNYGAACIYIDSMDRALQIYGNSIQAGTGTGVLVPAGTKHALHIKNNHFESCAVAVDLTGCRESSISENNFLSNTLAIDLASNCRPFTLQNNVYQTNTDDIQLTGTQADWRSYITVLGLDADVEPTYAGTYPTADYSNDTAPILTKKQIFDFSVNDSAPVQRFYGVGMNEAASNDTLFDLFSVHNTGGGANNQLCHGALAGTITLIMHGAGDNTEESKAETFQVLIGKWKNQAITASFTSMGDTELGVETLTFTIQLKSGATTTLATIEAKCAMGANFGNMDIIWVVDLMGTYSYESQVIYPVI